MTVTLTFCDKCGTVIKEGEEIKSMVLDGHEYDLCPDCYKVLTGDLQSTGRPVSEPEAPPISLPNIFTPQPQTGQWVPNIVPNTVPYDPQPAPWYPGNSSGVTWTAGTSHGGLATPTIANAISDAVASIGSAILVSNAAYFASHEADQP